MKKFLCTFAVLGSVMSSALAAQAPLSCDVQTLLVGATAMSRDVGVPRTKTVAALNKEGELTKAEVKFILDKVYVEGVGKTPDQIKDAVYKRCKAGR